MKIMIFCPNWVGDAVMATPTLRAIRGCFPDSEIVGLMKPVIADTLAGNRNLDSFWIHDSATATFSSTYQLVKRMRDCRFDIGVLLTNSMRSALTAFLGGIERRVGYARDGRTLLLNSRLDIKRRRGGYAPSPVIDYYLAIAYHLGASPESYQMDLATTPEDERRADQLWQQFELNPRDPVVVLNPGAAFGPAKRWPSQYFADLAQLLVDRHQLRVIVMCGPTERGFARFIANATMRPRFVKSMDQTELSLGLSKAVIRRASLLVTNDTGPRHFGAAYRIPVVSLFGPTHMEWTDTYHRLETRLQKKLSCGPCQLRECPLGHLRCMTELTVDMVYAACESALYGATGKKLAG